jgi:hypothetical protein
MAEGDLVDINPYHSSRVTTQTITKVTARGRAFERHPPEALANVYPQKIHFRLPLFEAGKREVVVQALWMLALLLAATLGAMTRIPAKKTPMKRAAVKVMTVSDEVHKAGMRALQSRKVLYQFSEVTVVACCYHPRGRQNALATDQT